MLDARRGGEERTAGSDQKIRYSSGGPISLDPMFISFFAIRTERKKAARMVRGEGGGRGWGGGR